MKRAQMTIFVLLGIVLLIAMLFLVFVATQRISKEPEKPAVHLSALSTIKSYVTSCLEKSAKEGLLLIGFSGGYIPDIVKHDAVLTFFNYSVAYGITEPTYSMAYPPAPVPDYPYKGKLEKKDFPYYGRDILHNLCDPHGPNKLGVTSLYRPCESYEDVTSIQQQLVQFITNKTTQCVKRSPTPISLLGNAIVNVTIGVGDVMAEMEFPFSFSTYEKKYVTEVISYSTRLPVRLKALHEFAKAIIAKDRIDHDFNPITDSINLPEYKGGFVLHKIQNACPSCSGRAYDDIIAISDELSQIDGKTYIFQFARENRIPPLEWIHDIPTVYDYDILVEENSNLALNPAGKDPDEETSLVYGYAQWKEDYNEYFDEDCPTLRTNPQQCVKQRNVAPHAWTASQLYLQTRQNASIFVNHSDIGKHFVKVSVTDRQGMTDYQNVTIFVRDRPFFNITGSSIYHDLPSMLASVEDPFTLQAIVRCIFWNCGNDYEWRIFRQLESQPYKIYKTDKPTYLMPSLSPSIDTIRQEPFTTTDERVKFRNGEFEFELNGLKILECLPHNDTDPNTIGIQASPPYPFQENINPFQASHMCCEGDPYDGPKVALRVKVEGFGTYSPPTKTCYSTKKLVCSPNLPSFDASKLISPKRVDSSGNIWDMPLTTPRVSQGTSIRDDQNDIYEFSFTQRCSGNRGNVCGGTSDYNITLNERCSDNGPNERCSGPPGVTKDDCFTRETAGCFNYKPGDSFEKTFLKDPSATGFCNTDQKLSPAEGIGNYNRGGLFLCKAQCNGVDGKCDYAADCTCALENDCKGRKPSELGLCITNIKCGQDCTVIQQGCI